MQKKLHELTDHSIVGEVRTIVSWERLSWSRRKNPRHGLRPKVMLDTHTENIVLITILFHAPWAMS